MGSPATNKASPPTTQARTQRPKKPPLSYRVVGPTCESDSRTWNIPWEELGESSAPRSCEQIPAREPSFGPCSATCFSMVATSAFFSNSRTTCVACAGTHAAAEPSSEMDTGGGSARS